MTKEFTTDSPSMDEIIRKKKPVRKWIDIPLDPDVAGLLAEKEEQIEEAEKVLNRERQRAQGIGKSLAEGSGVQDAQRAVERLEAELEQLWQDSEGSIVRFFFQDIGKKKYDDLVSAHPPTDEQVEEWKNEGGEGRLAYNTDTFPPALLAAASLEPKISEKQADKIFEEWGTWEVIRLFNTAQLACSGVSSIPKSRRSLTDTDEIPISD